MGKQYPKILIISHNLFDSNNNIGKTLISLLRGWPKEKLSQIYFRNDSPSFEYCSEYYCISDRDILKSVITVHNSKAGRVINKKDDLILTDTENKLYAIGNHRHPSVSLIRDILWDLGKWKTNDLIDWVSSIVKPDVLLFVPNDYCLAYKVALFIQSRTNIPIIPFYMDDAFYFDCKSSMIDQFRRKYMRSLAHKIHGKSKEILTICDYMSESYEKHFGLKCQAFVNSVEIKEPKENHKLSCPVSFTYMGNLHSNRWKSLLEIASALKFIEEQRGVKSILKIYSGSYIEEEIKRAFATFDNIMYMGSVPASEVREKQLESDILVHVEAFDRRSLNSTMLSLSTKIPEYISTGVPVFAFGPDCISSMKYLSEFRLAQTCNKKKDLICKLETLLIDEALRNNFSAFGLKRAREYHDINKVSTAFQNIIKQSV